jgi:hypothetical protein
VELFELKADLLKAKKEKKIAASKECSTDG